jgi:ATP-dependent DNA ligase
MIIQSIPERVSFCLDPLDPNFVAPKPIRTVSDGLLENLFRQGLAIPTRKRDGYSTIVVKTIAGINLYSRTIKLWTDRYPQIIESLNQLNIPNNTLICGEMLVDWQGLDDFSTLIKIAKSNLVKSRKMQLKTPAQFMPFNILVHKNHNISCLSNEDRFEILEDIFETRPAEFMLPLETISGTFADAKKLVIRNNWEGLVIYNRTNASGFRLDGLHHKPLRPQGSFKWKPRSRLTYRS